MRNFSGIPIRLARPEQIPLFKPQQDYLRPASRAFARSIAKTNNPVALVKTPPQTPPNPNDTTVFADSQFRIYDDVINSRQIAFSAGSIPASVLVTLTVPNISGTLLVGAPLPGDATKFFDGTGAWDTVKDTDLGMTAASAVNDVNFTKHGFVPIAPNDTTKFLRGDATWATVATGNHNILSATHSDTTGAGAETQGDLLVRNNANQWTRLPVGGSTHVLRGGTDPTYGTIDKSYIDNRTRIVMLPIGCWENNSVSVTGGSEPDNAAYINMPTAQHSYTHLIFRVPEDYVSTPIMFIYGMQSGTDGSVDFQLYVHTKKITLGTTLATAAADNSDAGTFFAVTTANKIDECQIAITTSIAAGNLLRFTIERDGVTDTNADAFRFLGAAFQYTADM